VNCVNVMKMILILSDDGREGSVLRTAEVKLFDCVMLREFN